jgi:hypothetical protein
MVSGIISNAIIEYSANFNKMLKRLIALFKKALDYLIQSMIKLGQAFLELDGIGVDAFIIGFIIIGLRKIRMRMDLYMRGPVSETHEEQVSM